MKNAIFAIKKCYERNYYEILCDFYLFYIIILY